MTTRFRRSHLCGVPLPISQLWLILSYGNSVPQVQPENSVIHVVDPLNGTIEGIVETTPQRIRVDLESLQTLNHYYQMEFQNYIQDILHSPWFTDQFTGIIVVSYTESVGPEISPFLPVNSMFVYCGHVGQGLPVDQLSTVSVD